MAKAQKPNKNQPVGDKNKGTGRRTTRSKEAVANTQAGRKAAREMKERVNAKQKAKVIKGTLGSDNKDASGAVEQDAKTSRRRVQQAAAQRKLAARRNNDESSTAENMLGSLKKNGKPR